MALRKEPIMPLDVRLVLAHLASAARTPHPSGRPCAVARRARLRRGLLAMLGAGALAGAAGCIFDEDAPSARTCIGQSLRFDGKPVAGELFTSPSTTHRIERVGAPGFFTWSMTPGAGGSITPDTSGATIVTPSASGRYTVKARSEVLGCELAATLSSKASPPLPSCAATAALLKLVSQGTETPLLGALFLKPGETVTLRGVTGGTVASATGATLVSDGADQWKYTAPEQPGEYFIGASTTACKGGVLSVVVGNDCFGAVATATRFGATTPFGPSVLQLEPGGKLTLGLTGAPKGATAAFSLVESPAFGSVGAGTYSAPNSQGTATLQATVKAGAQVLCTATQRVVVSTPTPILTPWPSEFLSVAGSTVVGGDPTVAVRANTDGGAFEELSGEATQVGGVAATIDGAFWTQAEGATTALVGSVPTSRTVYDRAGGLPGAATSDGKSVFYFASEPFVGGTLRKVTPPAIGGETAATLPPGDLVDAVTTDSGFVYWAASRTDANGLTQSVVTRIRTDLAGAPLVMSLAQHGVPAPSKIAGIAADTASVYLLAKAPNASQNTIRRLFGIASGGTGASTLFTTAPDAVAIAADSTYVYWLNGGAQLWRRAKASSGASELLLTVPAPVPVTPGYRGVALAVDATSITFATTKGLYRRAK